MEAFEIGEVSFHRGWLFHHAGANKSNKMRSVMTMIYMDKNMVELLSWRIAINESNIGNDYSRRLNREQNLEECDATGFHSSNTDGYIKKIVN